MKKTLRKVFPNDSKWVGKHIRTKAITWGAFGGATGGIITSLGMTGVKPSTYQAAGKVGVIGGTIFGMHAGAISGSISGELDME